MCIRDSLQYEPIAAAYSYALELTRPENALVFDFGGGTLDITVMRLGEGQPRVLATGGIAVAGDVFDQKLVRAKLPRHFGEGSLYAVSYTHLRAHETVLDLVCRLLLEKKNTTTPPRAILPPHLHHSHHSI